MLNYNFLSINTSSTIDFILLRLSSEYLIVAGLNLTPFYMITASFKTKNQEVRLIQK